MELGNRTPERKILGELSNTKSEPISPTANLRLLTSLASNLKSVTDSNYRINKIQNNNTNTNSSNSNISNNHVNINESSPIASGSIGNGFKLLPRKQKSLGLLCNKFLNMYPLNLDQETREISLDKTAKDLGTEKRRIYDIINVLESLDMASKAGKNRYLWHGQSNLTATLVRLKSTAIRLGLREQIQEIQKNYRAYTNDNDDTCNELMMSLEEPVDEETYYSDTAIKEDKSLGAMCQKFVMLFLVSMKNGVINLEIAAKVLILDNGDNQTEIIGDTGSRSRFKTKVRRLYDIANVLTAIGLIKKIYLFDRALKKPIFKYFGPDVESTESFDADTPISKIYNSSIGMSTPDKRLTPHSYHTYAATSANSGTSKTFIKNCYSTPTIDKRKLRKRKLFDADTASFSRTNSLPNLDNKSRSLERLDDSILRVAEMELEKLNSTEELKPKACTKLLTRYKSDSCIKNPSTSQKVASPEEIKKIKTDPDSAHPIIKLEPQTDLNNQSLVVQSASTENMYINLKVPQTALKTSQLNKINPTASSIVKTKPVHKIMKLIPIGSISTLQDPICASTTKILIPKPTGVDNNNTKGHKIARYKINQGNTTRVINLTKIDPNKLIPIKRSDIKFALAEQSYSKPIVMHQHVQSKDNTVNLGTNSGYAMLTRIQAATVSPGDTFKAIKVGNTLQLVPINSSNNK